MIASIITVEIRHMGLENLNVGNLISFGVDIARQARGDHLRVITNLHKLLFYEIAHEVVVVVQINIDLSKCYQMSFSRRRMATYHPLFILSVGIDDADPNYMRLS